jgi:hypothetical protein
VLGPLRLLSLMAPAVASRTVVPVLTMVCQKLLIRSCLSCTCR